MGSPAASLKKMNIGEARDVWGGGELVHFITADTGAASACNTKEWLEAHKAVTAAEMDHKLCNRLKRIRKQVVIRGGPTLGSLNGNGPTCLHACIRGVWIDATIRHSMVVVWLVIYLRRP